MNPSRQLTVKVSKITSEQCPRTLFWCNFTDIEQVIADWNKTMDHHNKNYTTTRNLSTERFYQ